MLLLARRGRGHTDSTVRKLADADRWAIGIELLLLLLVLAPLGSLARPFITGAYGALFWIGAVLAGLLAPIVLDFAARGGDIERRQRLRATLILVGGFVLRFVIVMAPQSPEIPPWHL
jgi:formate-dependent nitrite reductase membrane component NrfD